MSVKDVILFKKYLSLFACYFKLLCYYCCKQEVDDLKYMKYFMIMIADAVIAAMVVGGIWGVNYLIPQQGIEAVPFEPEAGEAGTSMPGSNTTTLDMQRATTPASGDSGQQQQNSNILDTPVVNLATKESDTSNTQMLRTNVTAASQDWHQKFKDQFTDQVVSTDTSYTSPDVAIHLTHQTMDTSRIDHSENGKHEKYGSQISYTVADIYVSDITHLQTAFAQNTYGVGYTEKLSDMSSRLNALLAVNGDSYSNDRHKDNGDGGSI